MSAYQRYFSPEQVESDHKDIIISQLKAELFEMRKGQREYDHVFARLKDTEAMYFDMLKELDMMKADFQQEEEEQIHEINVLRGELDNVNQKNDDKAAHADRLNHDISNLRGHLNGAEEEIRELNHKIRVLETDGERLSAEAAQLEDQLAFLDDEQANLLHTCAQVEQQVAAETKKAKHNEIKIQELIRQRDTLRVQLEKGLSDLDELRRAILDLRNAIADKDMRIAELNDHVNRLADELDAAQAENEHLVDELQRQKDLYNEQLAKNTALYDQINHIEKELAAVNAEIGKLTSELAYLEERYARATDRNRELVEIIEQLKIAIHELSIQIQTIIRELEQISQQDEHIRALLDRKAKIHELKAMTIEKVKHFSYTRTLTAGKPPAMVHRTMTVQRSGVKHMTTMQSTHI